MQSVTVRYPVLHNGFSVTKHFFLNRQVFVNFAKDQSDDHCDSSIRRKETMVNMALLSPLSNAENIEKPKESFVWAGISLYTTS